MKVDLPDAGHARDAHPHGGRVDPGVCALGEPGQQLAGRLTPLPLAGLDQRDGSGHVGTTTRADAVDERPDVGHLRPVGELLAQGGEQVEGGLGDDGAGQEHRRRAHLGEPRHVVGRDDAADDDHDVVAALLGERGLQRRQQREVTGRERADADDVHVVVDRLLRHLLGRGEQRAHVDVEAHVGERRDDDLLAAVVAVLAHLGHQDARPATLGLLELGGGARAPGRRASRRRRPTRRGTRRRSYG